MSIYYADESITLHQGDSLEVAGALPDQSVDCIVTSPPYYGLRDYGNDGQYGLEETPTAYVETMRALFSELRRVLANDGTLWLNIGDSYAGSTRSSAIRDKDASGVTRAALPKRCERCGETFAGNVGRRFCSAACGGSDNSTYASRGVLAPKNLMGIPWRVAFALQDDGWILRNAIIWHKPNAMPESVTDRLSCRYEQMFMFAKSTRYHFDLDPIREAITYPDAADGSRVFGGKNKAAALQAGSSERRTGQAYTADPSRGKNPGDMWSINTQPFPGAHSAVMPQELARRAIVAGCKPGGTVLDPFSGSGTTGLVAQNNGRKYIGIDISAEYLKLSLETRLQNAALDFGGAA